MKVIELKNKREVEKITFERDTRVDVGVIQNTDPGRPKMVGPEMVGITI